jgi:hypothetical protein
MHYQDNFARAKKRARDIIDCYSSQAQFAIIPLCPEVVDTNQDAFWTNKRSALAVLESINLTYKKGSVFNTLSSFNWQEARYPIERIYIGDGQAIAFTRYSDTMPPMYWVQVSSGGNCGISQVALSDPIALPSETYDLSITVSNFSATPWEGTIAVREPESFEEIQTTIAAGDNQSFQIALPADLCHGTVFLEHDRLAVDNAYYFSHRVPEIIRILLVGQNRFIMNGLETASALRTPFAITCVARLGDIDARLYDVIIVCGNVHITPVDRIMLLHIAERQTSSILCMLGNNVDEQMISFLAPYCSIGERIDPPGYVTLDWIDYDHPVFSIFRDEPALKRIKVFRYWSLINKANIRARMTDDRPLIISKDKVVIIATDVIPSSTDIVYNTAFIPLLFRLIMIGMQPRLNLELNVGEANPLTIQLKTPTGEFLPPGGEFKMPGHYSSGDTVLGINVIPEEGDLTPLNDKAAQLLHITPLAASDLTGTDLDVFFLMCALAFFLFEVILLLIR